MADFAYVQLPPWGIKAPAFVPPTTVAGYRSLLGMWMGGNVGVPTAAVDTAGFRSLLGLWMGGNVGVPTPAPGGGSQRDWRSSQAWHRSYTT